METGTVSFLAVFIAAVVNMVLGIVWYGPLFGSQWKVLQRFTEEDLQAMQHSAARSMAGGFVVAVLMSYVLARLLILTGAFGMVPGMGTAFWIWLGFFVPVTAGAVLWEGKPWRLWLLNAGFWFCTLLLMGGVIGLVQ